MRKQPCNVWHFYPETFLVPREAVREKCRSALMAPGQRRCNREHLLRGSQRAHISVRDEMLATAEVIYDVY
jgi:hypothetical protein